MATKPKDEHTLPRTIGFAKPPIIKLLSIIPDTPFYEHEIPPGYVIIDEALKIYHAHCLAYELNKQGRGVSLSMSELQSYLSKNSIQSFHVGPLMKVRNLPSVGWEKSGAIISQVYKEKHTYLTFDDELTRWWKTDQNVWVGYIDVINEDNVVISGQVVVLIDELTDLINSKNTSTFSDNPDATDEVMISRGGRPLKHDREAFLLEAFKIVYEGPEPSSLEDLMWKTSRSYSSQSFGSPPSETWMKERLRPLWRWIDEGRKGR